MRSIWSTVIIIIIIIDMLTRTTRLADGVGIRGMSRHYAVVGRDWR